MPQCVRNASATVISCHLLRASARAPAPGQRVAPGRLLAGAQQAGAVGDQLAPRRARAIPFEHREFGVMRGAALAVAKDMSELPDPRHPRDQQLLHRVFGRGMEPAPHRAAVARVVQIGRERPEVRFEPGADLQCRGLDLDKILRREKPAQRGEHPAALLQPRPAPGKALRPPPFLHPRRPPPCRGPALC